MENVLRRNQETIKFGEHLLPFCSESFVLPAPR